MHKNPYFYKYYWWIFSYDSAQEGDAFLSNEFRLPTGLAMQRWKKLQESELPAIVYNTKFTRRDPSNPFNYNHSMHVNRIAVSFAEDTDILWKGFR
jgi:hypothetical protein